ncbi:Uncharacterised protein [Mycobacteroides abscessus subsp. abscessus]|nr:Uncharacterised protein [Mycobacteroides abscessus subsp. abscessus]
MSSKLSQRINARPRAASNTGTRRGNARAQAARSSSGPTVAVSSLSATNAKYVCVAVHGVYSRRLLPPRNS